MLQVVGDGLFVEVVDDPSLASGGRTLHLHHTILDIYGDDLGGIGGFYIHYLTVFIIGDHPVELRIGSLFLG